MDAIGWNRRGLRVNHYMILGGRVCSVPTEVSAAERARWLAELSEVLNDAHRILNDLDLPDDANQEAQDLYLRIEAARLEVHALRLSRSLNPRSEIRSERIELAPWQQQAQG